MSSQYTVYSNSGVFTIHAGTPFESADGVLTLSRNINIPFLDWHGACAGIYMEHPLSHQTVNCGPNLGRLIDQGDIDIQDAAVGIVAGIAKNYRTLQHSPAPEKVEKELRTIKSLFN